jgi:hypothetical protein
MRYYVTTGTSLSQDSRCWFSNDELAVARQAGKAPRRNAGFDDQQLLSLLDDTNVSPRDAVDFIRSERGRGRCAIERLDKSLRGKELDDCAYGVAQERFDIQCWDIRKRHLLSAELSTLLTMSKSKQESFFSVDDSIEFLGGKTNRAETAMSSAVLSYLADEEYFPVSSENISCTCERELDPIDQSRFLENMAQLWNDVRPYDREREAYFVLTGGYKGVAIDLSVRIADETTKFYYLHENADASLLHGHGLVTLNIRQGRRVEDDA